MQSSARNRVCRRRHQGRNGRHDGRRRAHEEQQIILRSFITPATHISVQGNVGDSRAIISVNGIAEPLSYDHKPANESEAKRIIAAGGWVEFNRVNGNLALSRALGDFVFKRNDSLPAEEQIVTALPDVIARDMTGDVEFMVLACDGIWDVMSNQEVIDYCRDRLAVGMEPEMVCEELLTRCLAPDSQMGGLGCDNMTVVLVCLLQDASWQQFAVSVL